MTERADKRARVVVVVLALIATTGLRLLVHEPGPLYLLPIGLAGYWFGRWTGCVTGVACTVLYMATREIQPGGAQGSFAVALITRLAAYGGIGFAVGALAERVSRLRVEVHERDRVLEELREVQAALTPPEPPQRPALELATCYLPAEHGVSGDFHAVVPARDGATLIAVGDVAGRGIEAAKRSWYVRTLLISSADITTDPGTILERANQSLIQESGYGGFVTVACLLVRPDGSVDWALAGHDPPLRLGAGTPLGANGGSGLPLGVADRLGCVTATTQLGDGEGALLYTDGLTEARRPSNGSPHPTELFGEARVMKLAGELGGVSSAEVVDRMRAEVGEFSEGALADDLCLVALRRSEPAGS